jgi:hypothetical protein
MSTERAKILQMVAEGKVTPEEGEKLLDALYTTGSKERQLHSEEGSESGKGDLGSGPLKYLRVTVDGDDKVNVRVPIMLIRTGIKLSTLLPLTASEHLTEHGIDLSQFNNLDGDELTEALRELHVEVDTEDGDIVRVFCE